MATGALKWHYQETPGDQWDYTAVQHMILADVQVDGKPRKVLMQAPKNGFFYVIDRKTGELISADKYQDNVNWATGVDMKTGRPVEAPNARYEEAQTQLQIPGPLGSHNWHPMAFSPDTGLVYIPVVIISSISEVVGVAFPGATALIASVSILLLLATLWSAGLFTDGPPLKTGPRR